MNAIVQAKTRRHGAFTMIELLVVISIVAVLAGLVAMVGTGAVKQSKIKKAEAQIVAIGEALHAYKNEYANFPRPVGGSTDPIVQAKMLYQALTGDGTSFIDGVPPTPSDGNPGTDGDLLLEAAFPGSKKASFVDDDYYLKDPWLRPYNYMRGDENNQTFNTTTFDLWTEASPKPNDDDETWIANWHISR